jgi:hypothetical protein
MGPMNYRTFTDIKGRRWEVWLVLPTSAERRAVERRMLADRRAENRPHTIERRAPVDRRRVTYRRLGVAQAFSQGWLCFESGDEKRRLAPVPEEWDGSDSGQLEEWCVAAKRVEKPAPQG